jgi:hypothetical protein
MFKEEEAADEKDTDCRSLPRFLILDHAFSWVEISASESQCAG